MQFDFATSSRIIFGPGKLGDLAAVIQGWGARACVVTGRSAGRGRQVEALLASEGMTSVLFHVPSEPTLTLIQQGVEICQDHRCDLVIAIGGGSAIDAGKAMAALATNRGAPLEYLEVIGEGRPLAEPPLPFVAIPTTSGTGAEVTRNAVIASEEHRVKVSLRSPLMLAKVAIVDPELTYALPADVTATAGLDALTQLIEPYVSCRANALTDTFCREGIQRCARSLRPAYEQAKAAVDPSADAMPRTDMVRARADLSLASLFSGLALANAGLGAVHAFAGPFGGLYAAPHGAVCAALLPAVMRANAQALRERAPEAPAIGRYREVSRWLTGNKEADIEDGIGWVRQLQTDFQVPPLRHYGLRATGFDEMIGKAEQASSMKGNPLPLTEAESRSILEEAW